MRAHHAASPPRQPANVMFRGCSTTGAPARAARPRQCFGRGAGWGVPAQRADGLLPALFPHTGERPIKRRQAVKKAISTANSAPPAGAPT